MRALRPSSHPPFGEEPKDGDFAAKEENILRYQKLAAVGAPLFGEEGEVPPRRKRVWSWLGRTRRVAPTM